MNNNKINIAVIGYGNWGKNIVRTYNELGNLYAICESDENKKDQIKSLYPNITLYTNVEMLLKDENIDAIVIATPAQTHFELAKKSLTLNFPTFVEKPLTLTLKGSEELVNIAKQKGLPLMVGHIMVFNPAIIKIKELVDSGKFGKVKHIKCIRVNLGKIRSHENIWWSFAPHDLSIIFLLLNKNPITINTCSFQSIQEGIEDTVYTDLTFDSGESAHIQVSWLEPVKLHQTTIICEKAIIVFNDITKQITLYEYIFDSNKIELNKLSETIIEYTQDPPLKLECEHFIECTKNNSTPITDGESSCRIINILEQVDKKLKQPL